MNFNRLIIDKIGVYSREVFTVELGDKNYNDRMIVRACQSNGGNIVTSLTFLADDYTSLVRLKYTGPSILCRGSSILLRQSILGPYI